MFFEANAWQFVHNFMRSRMTLTSRSQNESVSAISKLFSPDRLVMLVVVLAAALAMSPNVADPDLWGHVQFGRDVLESGEIAKTTTYSYTADGFRWINHENLSEIVMAMVADSLGPLGLVWGKFLLSLLVIILIFRWNLKQGVGLIVASVITLLVAANLGYHWSIRPQLSSFLGFTLLLLLLQYCFAGWRDRWHAGWPRRWFDEPSGQMAVAADGQVDIRARLGYQSHRMRLLWLAPPLFFLWANSHGGFVAGLAVYVAYLGCRGLEALNRGGGHGWGLVRRMTLMAIVAVLATMLNPYGPRLHLWLLESLGSPRPEISDWSNRELLTVIGAKFWLLLAVAAIALGFSKRKLDATQIIILCLTAWQSMSHFRHVAFFAILCGFWIAPHLQSAMQRLSQSAQTQPISGLGRVAMQALLLVCIGLIGSRLQERLSDLQVYRDQFPVDAIDYMRQNHLNGRLVVTYDWAQYSIAALCASHLSPGNRSLVAFDGRFRTCYPQSIVDMHFDFLYGHAESVRRYRSPQSPPCDPSRVLFHKQPELVLLRRNGELTEQHMRMNRDRWSLLYQDAIAQVWGLRALFDDPNSSQYVPPHRRIVHNLRSPESVSWPAIYGRQESLSNPFEAVDLAVLGTSK